MKGASRKGVLLALGVTVLIWASAFAGIRAALESYSPGHLALLRFLVASTLLAAYAVAVRMPLPSLRDLPAVLLGGFLGFTVYHVGLAFGQVTVEAGSASLIIASVPVFTALLAAAATGTATPIQWTALGSLLTADRDWVPEGEGTSLYLRPFMFASEAFLGVRPARQYKFVVIASPGTGVLVTLAAGLSRGARAAVVAAGKTLKLSNDPWAHRGAPLRCPLRAGGPT